MSVLVNFIGRIGSDAETVTSGATPFISFRVAVDDTVRKEQKTRWITVSGSVESLQNIAKYLTKGKPVHVRGIERVSGFITKTGEPGVDTRVWAEGIDFIPTGNPNGQQHQGEKDKENSQMTTGPVKTKVDKMPDIEPQGDVTDDDDLPF